MKPHVLIFLFILYPIVFLGQEYSFPLYFEDSAGNRDTLIIGFDKSATFGVDELLGERNIISQAYDSPFFAFFTDAVSREESDCLLQEEKNPTFVLKKQYINRLTNTYAEIGFLTKNYPIKISWNKKDFQNFHTTQYLGTGMQMVITNFHPFNGYPDIPCCYHFAGLTKLSESSEFIIEKNNSCQYTSDFNINPVDLLYVGYMHQTTSVIDFQKNNFLCWYNQKSGSVNIINSSDETSIKFEVLNIWGIKLMEQQINSPLGSQINININQLKNGLYLIRLLRSQNDNLLISTFKIIKR